ncbi:MAG: hypothetical protein FGM15_04595 [Chthoniobacterales bacterium]|nr:hypothetical protein [Chthoniobacterales bacterium]
MADQSSTSPWAPAPDRNASVKLPPFLAGLTERLAGEVHERWARQRMAEGWRYGPVRDEKLKTTPNLVAYDNLPEAEKDVDRGTALTTLRTILGEGYTIVPAVPASDAASGEIQAVEMLLRDAGTLTFEAADALRRSKPAEFWAAHPALLLRLARHASDAGWPLMVFDMASQALARRESSAGSGPCPEDGPLRYLEVLSLVEVGALERAAQELAKLENLGGVTGDLQGLRGRIAKMQGLRATQPDEARVCFERSKTTYEKAYRAARENFSSCGKPEDAETAYYLGINAATLGAWAGRTEESKILAREVLDLCDRAESSRAGSSADPWLEATRGEAHLLLHDGKSAGAAYSAAAHGLKGQWRPLQSMRRQALETARRTGFPEAKVESWFRLPGLHVAGLDGEGDAPPADGSIVFFYLNDARQLERAAHLVPRAAEFHLGTEEPLDKFRERLSAAQGELLDKILAGAARVLGQNEIRAAGQETTPVFTKLFFRGLALLRAGELDLVPHGLPSPAQCGAVPGQSLPFRALLCADAKGYSRLEAERLRIFCRDFLGCVAGVVDSFREHTLTVKTAGDGLFMAFRDVPGAIRFGLELRDATAGIDWTRRGFPEDLGLRISLDAGPVMEFKDPVTGRDDVAGRLVNRAARIEPVTPVNHVYASRTMAALALALDVPGVRFEYAGETALPKGFGTFPLYHVTRK